LYSISPACGFSDWGVIGSDVNGGDIEISDVTFVLPEQAVKNRKNTNTSVRIFPLVFIFVRPPFDNTAKQYPVWFLLYYKSLPLYISQYFYIKKRQSRFNRPSKKHVQQKNKIFFYNPDFFLKIGLLSI